ncbi:MAG: sulfatase-like hydrolase/transferase [Chloroflexi bacterium]|nr:sulfatase-like hydrolase/transferase [Chloroflexota bacterium]
MNKPNVILLTIDTLRADMLHCYGYHAPLTPNLDGLAASGIRFEQAITGGSWTQAAFPVLLTSSYAAMYGGCLGRLAPERPSPVETLATQGYTPDGFSTNPHLSRATGYDRGFHHFSDLTSAEADPRLRRIRGGQRLLRNRLIHSVLRPIGKTLRPARLYSSAAEVTDTLCHWLERVEMPFFAWAHYMDLHWPYHLEETLTHPREIAQAWQDLAIMYGRSNFNRSESISTAQRDRFLGLYQQSLQYLDIQIGRLTRHLDRLGYGANTIVIAVSDHGEEFLDHGRWGHWESNLYDEILKVPLIIRMPNWPHGQVIRQQVRLLDLMPTILDLCDCPLPDGLMGASLVPLWTQREADYESGAAISEMRRDPWHRIAVRTEAFKYIWDSKRPHQPELYDLRADPGEKQNVSEHYSQEVHRFQASVDAHLRRVAETEPVTTAPAPEFDEEVTRRLRDLGYIE